MILEGSYSISLVILSVIVAIFAAYTALNLIARLNDPHSKHLIRIRIVAGGLVLGLGIWSMHFVGMMAYVLPVPVRYDGTLTVWSLVAAITACIVGLSIISRRQTLIRIVLGGTCLGLGIVAMHFTGMDAMRISADIQYNMLLVTASVLIGIGASIAAVQVATAIGCGEISGTLRIKISSAAIMGAAIAGMHYTGMAALTIYQKEEQQILDSGFELNPAFIAVPLALTALLLMSLKLWSSWLVAETNHIRANEERVSAITENVGEVILTIDSDGIIEFANAAVENVFGYQREELIGRNISMLMPEPWRGKHDSFVKTSMNIGRGKPIGIRQRQLQALRKDNSTFPIDLVVSETEVSGKKIFIGTIRDITDQIETQKQLYFLAHHDVLTTLPNRLSFLEHIDYALTHARRRDCLVAVLFMDLDRFKVINDTLGHHVGDFLLQEVAQRLKSSIREGDTVARLSGDEFTILLDDINNRDDIKPIAQKLITSFSKPIVYAGQELYTTASIGISVFPSDGSDPQTMMQHADIAMYSAKTDGGNCFHFYSPDMNARADERLQLETSLRHALKREEFVIYYQPQLDTETNSIYGVEALIRWQHPERGLIPPMEFISMLEETGLIVQVGEWAIRKACEQHMAWRKAGYKPVQVAVNLSARQFNEKNLVQSIARIFKETGMEPEFLELEITENILMHQNSKTINTIHQLHTLGVKLAIDDFGTGYSSLSYLRKIPIHTLKIDRSFVRDISTDADDAAIVQLIIDMAHSLDLNVVAEGIENEEQLDYLRKCRCRYVQGYYVAPTALQEDIENYLDKRGEAGAA